MAVNEEKKEYADWLKSAAKELIDGIGTDSGFDLKTLECIYTYIRTGYLESRRIQVLQNKMTEVQHG